MTTASAILDVAQRLLARNGWRSTTLAPDRQEAGVTSPACCPRLRVQGAAAARGPRCPGQRDDEQHAYRHTGDLAEGIASAAERFCRSPELVGTFAVLMAENRRGRTPARPPGLAFTARR